MWIVVEGKRSVNRSDCLSGCLERLRLGGVSPLLNGETVATRGA